MSPIAHLGVVQRNDPDDATGAGSARKTRLLLRRRTVLPALAIVAVFALLLAQRSRDQPSACPITEDTVGSFVLVELPSEYSEKDGFLGTAPVGCYPSSSPKT